jgi:hypothetical protein
VCYDSSETYRHQCSLLACSSYVFLTKASASAQEKDVVAHDSSVLAPADEGGNESAFDVRSDDVGIEARRRTENHGRPFSLR